MDVKVERGAKRVRAVLAGETVVDTISPLLVWEKPYYPTYYFDLDDLRSHDLTETGETKRSPRLGTATFFHLQAGDKEGVAYRYLDSPVPELREAVAIRWDTMDHWFEEDEEVHVHPRDPYKRVDILNSSRHVQVSLDGVTLADSNKPTLLFETSLPTRYYLPPTDVRMELLTPTDRHTSCPYKGVASYWTVEVDGKQYVDYVWSYPYPVVEAGKISGLFCFYNEKVDLMIDGVREERPRSPFS